MTVTVGLEHDPTTRGAGTAQARRLLRLDAGLCALSGLACLVGATPLSRLLADERPGAVRLVGAALLAVAVDFALLARVHAGRLPAATTVAAATNLAWVLGSVAFVAAGAFVPLGVLVVVATSGAIAAFAVAEVAAGQRARRDAARTARGRA